MAMRQTAKYAEKVGLKPIKKMAYRYTFHPDPYYIKEIREFFEDLEEDDVETENYIPVIVAEAIEGKSEKEIIVNLYNGLENFGDLFIQMSFAIKNNTSLFDVESYITWLVFTNIGNFCWDDPLGELEYSLYGWENEEDEEE